VDFQVTGKATIRPSTEWNPCENDVMLVKMSLLLGLKLLLVARTSSSLNFGDWLVIFACGYTGYYLWRSALFPKEAEPKEVTDRSIRIIGAVLMSAITVYLGFFFKW
jgi:hypothetical protein